MREIVLKCIVTICVTIFCIFLLNSGHPYLAYFGELFGLYFIFDE